MRLGIGLGLSNSRGPAAGGGYYLEAIPTTDTTGTAGVISQLYTNLTGTLVYSKVSGDARISINASTGAISAATPVYLETPASFIARVLDSVSGTYVDTAITITGTVATPEANFIRDSFTESSDTNLSSHVPEVGGSWVSSANTMTVRGGGGYVDGSSTSSTGIYYNTATPPSANYTIEAVMQRPAADTTFRAVGVLGRYQDASNYYHVYYNDGTGELLFQKVISGTNTTLGVSVRSFPANTDYTLKMIFNGSNIQVQWNGVTVFNATDTAISTAGKVAIRGRTGGKILNLLAYP